MNVWFHSVCKDRNLCEIVPDKSNDVDIVRKLESHGYTVTQVPCNCDKSYRILASKFDFDDKSIRREVSGSVKVLYTDDTIDEARYPYYAGDGTSIKLSALETRRHVALTFEFFDISNEYFKYIIDGFKVRDNNYIIVKTSSLVTQITATIEEWEYLVEETAEKQMLIPIWYVLDKILMYSPEVSLGEINKPDAPWK